MLTATRISKKTFFAAAAFGLASVFSVPAVADYTSVVPNSPYRGKLIFNFDDYSGTSDGEYLGNKTVAGSLDFVKTGTGDLKANLGSTGRYLYGMHYMWWAAKPADSYGAADFIVRRVVSSGEVVGEGKVEWGDDISDSRDLLEWTSGEVRVEKGTLELTGFVNAWFDFGTAINNYYDAEYGTNGGKMTGATRITIDSGAVLDLSGNNNSTAWSDDFYSMSGGHNGNGAANAYLTYFQFLHNLQAGDNGDAATATLRLGTSPSLHVNIHIDGWDENTRSLRGNGTYLDNSLAFGGSVGVLQGAAAVYKTGAGDLTLLNTSSGFTGELYAAGGELTLAGDNSAGLGSYTFDDGKGTTWKAKISSAYASAESVNIAGTYSEHGLNGESRLGATIRGWQVEETPTSNFSDDGSRADFHQAYKEAYFTSPSAGTLVIAENQQIKNFQSYFNAGASVASGTTAAMAVAAAGELEVSYGRTGIDCDSIVATAPIIAGTGTGSTLVIPGGNYAETFEGSGNWVLQTNADGEMLGGVLLINQEEGMGGVYEGSIVGCRVSIYDRAAFKANTEAAASVEDAGKAAERLKNVLVGKDAIQNALDLTDDEIATLNIQSDGSFALDNEVAWKVVDYYKALSASNTEDEFYIDYQADANVTGGILALDGKGDLALLLEQANFGGINIAATRTGKTVVNIAVLNSLSGSISALGGAVSIVTTQKDTLKTKLSFAEGTKLIFTTADTIKTVVREANDYNGWDVITPGKNTIMVGDVRKSVIAFNLVQDLVYGDVYVERGLDLDLSGSTESIFPNASSLTLWKGADSSYTVAAPTLTLKGSPTDTGITRPNDDGEITYVQTINNLTGDVSAIIDMGSGVLIANITNNEVDDYSGLTRGTFDGFIRGEGSLVKGGEATLTLGGGERNIYTGTTEVGAGTLNISKANGLTRSSALILNTGTAATMAPEQSLRNLFGASGSSVIVGTTTEDEDGNALFTAGALTVGSNAKIETGENRPLFVNNLGTATLEDSVNYDNSFARFERNYDREGNLVVSGDRVSYETQADATKAYLTATAKLAYSGFEAGALEQFVGVKDYDGTELLSTSDYNAIVAYAKTQKDVPTEGFEQGGNLLSELATVYQKLETEKFYLDNITKTNGYYDPSSLLRGFYDSEAEYRQDLEAKGLTMPTGTVSANEQAQINADRFLDICEWYKEKLAHKQYDDLKAEFTSEAAARAKFLTDFGALENLGGTAFYDKTTQEDVDKIISAYGVALESGDGERVDECLAAVIAAYRELAGKQATLEAKQQFAGIVIEGAFASDVTTDGALRNASWVNNLAYAGTLTVSSLTKTGDNTLRLTGTLNADKISVDGGTLRVNLNTLPEVSELVGGISVARGATFALDVSAAESGTLDYAVSGAGNFVKYGAGSLVLGENVLYTGTTTIEGGTLQMTLRNPRSFTDANGNNQFLAAQDSIYITGSGAGLILDQQDADEPVVWTKDLIADEKATGVSVKKTGAASLEISGTTDLSGENASLTVDAGTLKLSGKFILGENALLTIASGATLSVAELEGESSTVAIRGAGSLVVDGDADLAGLGISAVEPVPANGSGLTWDAYYGSVTVNKGTLTLGGESLFDYARGVQVKKEAKLSVVADSTQKLKTVEGAGALDLAGTLVLENNAGSRLDWDWASTKNYIFEEGNLFDAPAFTGSVSGDGTLEVSGRGMMSFTGALDVNVAVNNGGQLVLDAAKANALQDYGKTIAVKGGETYTTDAQGLLVLNATIGKNYSSEVKATDSDAFYVSGDTYYAPRNLAGSYKDANGNTVSVSADDIVVDEATGKLIDGKSGREVTVSATEWDYVVDGVLSANWAVLDEDGNVVDLTTTPNALVWSPEEGKFVLGTYKTETNETEAYAAGYQALAVRENEDGSTSLVVADLSKGTSETLISELLLSADQGSASDGVILNSGLIAFEDGGMLGKIGDGKLSVAGSDLSTENGCGGVNVYEGELELTGGEWVLTDANAARVALGATLAVELNGSNEPDFTTVYGSGTLKLTGKGSFSIGSTLGALKVLPIYKADGKFFNGITDFDGAFSISISGIEMSAINTSEDVTLTLNDGAVFTQTQNSEIAGSLMIAGDVTVKGLSEDSGSAVSADARRLTVGTYTGGGTLTLKNVGFAYDAAQEAKITVDRESVKNTFYFTLAEGETVNKGTLIELGTNAKPGQSAQAKLAELSMIMSGDTSAKWAISGKELSELGSASKDGVFGIGDTIYNQLASQNGTLNVGVEAGVLFITNLDAYKGTTANGVDIDLLTLRSNVGATAGTLEFSDVATYALRSSETASSMATLSETISGGGNVAFSDPSGTLVTAKQDYLGLTTVSGKVQLSGDGQSSRSSQFTVEDGGEFIGGLDMLGREISVSGSMRRNMNDAGTAGTTTLKLALSDPRLPTTITLQLEVSATGTVSSPKIYAESSLKQYGISVEFPKDEETGEFISVNKDGVLEIKITDEAYGETYSVALPVDVDAFPSKVNQSTTYSATTIPVSTTFTLESGATWTANVPDNDGVSATNAVLNGTIKLEGLSDSGSLGKDVALVDADSITSANGKSGSDAVTQALRKGRPEENVMVYTDADGVVNVRVLNDDFAAIDTEYHEGISPSFLDALSAIASFESNDLVNGVLNADNIEEGQAKDLFFALNSLTVSQFAQEVEKLSPNLFASMLAMPVATFNGDVARLHARLDQRRYDGANPLRESGEYEFFAFTQGDFAENDKAYDTPTFDYNLYGVTAGYDWKPNYETTLGVALGYTYGKATAHNGGGKVNMDDMRITAFASRLFGRVYLDAGVQAGFADFDTRRNTIAGRAKGDTDSLYAGTFVTLGSVFSLWQNKKEGSGLYFTPSIGLSYLHTEIDGFSENGTAGLKLDDTDGDSLRARIAAAVQWVFPFEAWEMRLGAELAYTHDFLGDELDMNGRFVAGGPEFGTSGKALPKDIFSFGPTLDILVSERTSLYLGYGIEIDTDSGVSQNVNAGIRHRF